MKVYTKISRFNADMYTPVELYMLLRNQHRKACLLESNDYHSRQDSRSFICFDPLIEIVELDKTIHHRRLFDRIDELIPLNNEPSIQLQGIVEQYEFDNEQFNGFFGRIGFEFTGKEEANIEFSENQRLPLFHLFLYEVIIVIDQYTNDGYVIHNGFEKELPKLDLDELLRKGNRLELPFELIGNERSMLTDDEFQKNVELGIEHCKKGDVFQLVLSNEFQYTFFGDDFQVYRELRRLNPSPYLFYFDFEDYRLFGSSPEAQLIISEGACQIHPIAGTIPRTGVPETDDSQLSFLLEDEKENAEHTMLVDLARNDLSRDCKNVKVVKYKEVQHFSHVTHLVSKVQGELKGNQLIKTFSHSFPAGTLSGTPKPKALELIRKYEPLTRDFYGGSIGFFTPSKNLNMAIVIRSVMSRNNTLFYRAGAGVVLDSIPEREVAEVHHKLKALRTAIERAQKSSNFKSQHHEYSSH